MFRRYYVPVVVVALAALSFVTLARGVEAETATATWNCGSVLNPTSMRGGLAGVDQPSDAQIMFIAGEAACSSRRDEALGDALRYLLPALGLAVAVALSGAARERSEAPQPHDVPAA